MKKIILIFSILAFGFISACSNNSQNNNKSQEDIVIEEVKKVEVSLTAEVSDRGYYIIGGPNPDTLVGGPNPDSTIVYHLNLELINNSMDSITFISMNCSHEDMFVVEDSIKLRVHPYYMCFGNFPVAITLAPNEKYSKSIMISPIDKQLSHLEKTRIGLRFIEGNPKTLTFEKIIDGYHNRHSSNNTIWSNEIKIEK